LDTEFPWEDLRGFLEFDFGEGEPLTFDFEEWVLAFPPLEDGLPGLSGSSSGGVVVLLVWVSPSSHMVSADPPTAPFVISVSIIVVVVVPVVVVVVPVVVPVVVVAVVPVPAVPTPVVLVVVPGSTVSNVVAPVAVTRELCDHFLPAGTFPAMRLGLSEREERKLEEEGGERS
jgi:hypothetical protein